MGTTTVPALRREMDVTLSATQQSSLSLVAVVVLPEVLKDLNFTENSNEEKQQVKQMIMVHISLDTAFLFTSDFAF